MLAPNDSSPESRRLSDDPANLAGIYDLFYHRFLLEWKT
jgi:hypothetical protein